MEDEAVHGTIATCVLDALAIGVIVTDAHARRLYANAAAHRLLSQPAGALRCCNAGKVFAARHETQTNLHALISRACSNGVAVAGRRTDSKVVDGGRAMPGSNYILVPSLDRVSPDLAICILPVDPGRLEPGIPPGSAAAGRTSAMMLVRPIEQGCNLEIEARRLLGLTRAEARLASGLAAGLSLQEAAEAQDVTLATVRSHLKSIFRKTGLRRQGQLVALLRSTQIPVETSRQDMMVAQASVTADLRG